MLPRKITRFDKTMLVQHFVNDITGEDRRLRFGYPAQDAAVETYINRAMEGLHSVNEWFVVEDQGKIVATCHVAFSTDEQAEMGCTVSPELRGTGIGQELFDRGVTWARAQGATSVYMQCLSENKVIQHIAKKNAMTTVTLDGHEKEASMVITKSVVAAQAADNVTEMFAICDTVGRAQQHLFSGFLRKIVNR